MLRVLVVLLGLALVGLGPVPASAAPFLLVSSTTVLANRMPTVVLPDRSVLEAADLQLALRRAGGRRGEPVVWDLGDRVLRVWSSEQPGAAAFFDQAGLWTRSPGGIFVRTSPGSGWATISEVGGLGFRFAAPGSTGVGFDDEPPASASLDALFSDGFESGGTSAWSGRSG